MHRMRFGPLMEAIFLFLGLVAVGSAQAQGQQETLKQRIERLQQAEEQWANSPPQDRIIRLRAEEIRAREALKKAIAEAKRTADPAMRKALGEEETRLKKQNHLPI